MKILQKENRHYLQSNAMLQNPSLIHGFTARQGGVSTGKISGLNLGFRVGDNPDSVMENYHLVAQDLGFRLEDAVLARQAHTDNIRLVTRKDAGKGLTQESDITDTDALITAERNIALVVFSADCVPILLFDPNHLAIAAIHAGWRGTVKGIAGKAVQKMAQQFGSRPEDLLAAVGPSIGPCCFAFGEDAQNHFPSAFCTPRADGGFLVDLWAMNRAQLLENGLLPTHIDLSEICTVCHKDTFYSYRSQREHTGRQAAIIMLT